MTNPLTKIAKGAAYVSKFTAAEYAAMARELGLIDKAKAWDRRAAELGEERIPNGITVRFRKDGSKERVQINPTREK